MVKSNKFNNVPKEITRDMVLRSIEEKDKAERKLEDLENKLLYIQGKIHGARWQEQTATKAWNEIAAQYAQQEVQTICEAMVTSRLPREIRDMIYESYWSALISEHGWNKGFRKWNFTMDLNCKIFAISGNGCLHPNDKCRCFNPYNFPRAMLPACVGAQVAHEACLKLTKIMVFSPGTRACQDGNSHSNTGFPFENLANFVKRDFLRVGIPLGEVRVSKIHMWLDHESHLFREKPRPKARAYFGPLSRKKMEQVKQTLQELLNFRFPQYLNILFQVSNVIDSRPHFSFLDVERFFELFRDVYFELVKCGCKTITFSITSTWSEKNGWKENCLHDYYHLPLTEYRAKYDMQTLIEVSRALPKLYKNRVTNVHKQQEEINRKNAFDESLVVDG